MPRLGGGPAAADADVAMLCLMVLLGGQEPVSTLIGGAACLLAADPTLRDAGSGPSSTRPLA